MLTSPNATGRLRNCIRSGLKRKGRNICVNLPKPLPGGLFKNVIEVQLVYWDKRFNCDYVMRCGVPDYMELLDVKLVKRSVESI